MRELWREVVAFWFKYEHHIGVGAIVSGFLFDLWIAKRPDSLPNNILLLSYLLIAGAFIIILNLYAKRRKTDAEPLLLLLILQFCFGGLASNLLVLYGHSGTLAADVLFLGLLLSLVLGNEFLRGRYTILRFNVGMYYVLMLTYLVVAVPTFVTHSIGTLVFLFSGLLSLLCIAAFLAALFFTVFRGEDTAKLREVGVIVLAIYIAFNGLYALNVIPPVPLALKDIGIYHSLLSQDGGGYLGLYEPAPWYAFWADNDGTYRLTDSRSAFCFSSVFAPTDLETPIYHKWEYKDPQSGEWQVRARVSFAISGGREEGYRGFSVKSSLAPGEWRCDVETAQGALIGRTAFTAVEGPSVPALLQRAL